MLFRIASHTDTKIHGSRGLQIRLQILSLAQIHDLFDQLIGIGMAVWFGPENMFALIADYVATDRQLTSGQFKPYGKVTLRKEASESNLIYRFKKKILRRR